MAIDGQSSEVETTVTKIAYRYPVATGTCHCGQPLLYNLAVGFIDHSDPAHAEQCSNPYPEAAP